MQILKMIDGKLSLAHVTPVIRALFAPFGVQDDGTLNPKNLNPMWLDLIPFLRTLMDTLAVDCPAEVTSVAMLNAIAQRVGQPEVASGNDDRDGETYSLTDAFDLAVGLDDGHGLIEATMFVMDHDGEGPDTTTRRVTRHIDLHDSTMDRYIAAAEMHDALRRKDYRRAAALIDEEVHGLLTTIRDPKARKKVAKRIQISH